MPGGSLAEGAPADITILAPDLRGHRSTAAAMRSRSKNTPFDGWQLRGGVAATIVGGRVGLQRVPADEASLNARR